MRPPEGTSIALRPGMRARATSGLGQSAVLEPETMLETIDRELVEAERGAVQVRHARSTPQAVAEVLAGAAAGAALGALAGPWGALVGALLGALAGAAAEVALERDQACTAQREAELDADIGTVGGHIGDAPPGQPPPRIGAFSAAVSGARTSSPPQSDGPIQNVDAP